jgi:hypothetical protein
VNSWAIGLTPYESRDTESDSFRLRIAARQNKVRYFATEGPAEDDWRVFREAERRGIEPNRAWPDPKTEYKSVAVPNCGRLSRSERAPAVLQR